MDVSVVICAYTEQRWDDLLSAIDSVKRQTRPAREIVLVIDHNPSLLERARGEIAGVRVADNPGPRGEAGARNTGALLAQAEVVAFLDDDAVAESTWLEWLLRGYDDPRVVGVGGAIVPCWERSRPGWFPPEFDWVVGCSYRGQPRETVAVRNVIGANMSFRRAAFREIGGLRTSGGLGRVGANPIACAETELCIRIRQNWPEARVLLEPRASVHHRVPSARACWSYFRQRCFAEGRSKARVARFTGSDLALASERTYALRTLPTGLLRELGRFVIAGQPEGLTAAAAILAGFALATAGYVAAWLPDLERRRASSEAVA